MIGIKYIPVFNTIGGNFFFGRFFYGVFGPWETVKFKWYWKIHRANSTFLSFIMSWQSNTIKCTYILEFRNGFEVLQFTPFSKNHFIMHVYYFYFWRISFSKVEIFRQNIGRFFAKLTRTSTGIPSKKVPQHFFFSVLLLPNLVSDANLSLIGGHIYKKKQQLDHRKKNMVLNFVAFCELCATQMTAAVRCYLLTYCVSMYLIYAYIWMGVLLHIFDNRGHKKQLSVSPILD